LGCHAKQKNLCSDFFYIGVTKRDALNIFSDKKQIDA
jgi:hypothetical protein